MKKALSMITVLMFLVLTLTGCKIETVKEHNANTSVSETESEMSPAAEDSTTDNSEGEKITGATSSKDTLNESSNPAKNDGTASEISGQRTTQSKVENTSGNGGSGTTQNEKTTEKTTEKVTEKTTSQPQSINVTVSVTCEEAVKHDSLKPGIDLKDGIVIDSLSIAVKKGESVFDATKKACEKSGTAFSFNGSMFGKYVNKIGPIAEKECGAGSGWTYTVNGEYPNITCDSVVLKNGDKIKWIYKVA